MITDLQRLEFMQKLAGSTREKNGLLLPDWENQFLGSFLQSSRPALWFTEGRRTVTDKMWMRFGPEINFPHPLDCVPQRPTVAAEDPDGCQYQVRSDSGRPQGPCNEPATHQEPGRLRYCTMHAEAVVKDLKRAGKTFRLISFQASSAPAPRVGPADGSRAIQKA